jgi:hypothetical protein
MDASNSSASQNAARKAHGDGPFGQVRFSAVTAVFPKQASVRQPPPAASIGKGDRLGTLGRMGMRDELESPCIDTSS